MHFEVIVKFLYGFFGKGYMDHLNFNDYYRSLIWITLVMDINCHFGMILKQYGKTEGDCFRAWCELTEEFIRVRGTHSYSFVVHQSLISSHELPL
jgi:hypothetical protein